MSRTSRLFELINVLRARRTPVSAQYLAGELGISTRSVYRDIETLRALGAPLDGQAGIGYSLRKGFFLPEFAFSSDELDALILGLGWVSQRADPALAKSSESALAKILAARTNDASLPEALPALVSASLSEAMDPAQVAQLRDAIRRQRKIEIGYKDAAGALSERTLWPLAIVYFDDIRILAAWCEQRSAFRHFRVDRVQLRAISAERYPGRRESLMARWQEQDRDWRSMLTVSDTRSG